MSKLLNKFFSPDDGVGGDNTPPTENKEDVIEFLGLEDDDKPEILELKGGKEKVSLDDDDKKIGKTKDDKTKDETKEDEKDEVDEELAALEEELEEPTEEQLELMTPVRRREILKEYPDLFKKFPYLERAYYREQQFTEVHSTIEEAKESKFKAEAFDRFDADIASGNTETILKEVHKVAPEAFYKIVDDYLPTLARVDEKAYYHVLANVTKHTIQTMVAEARRSNNEVLQSAAQILNQFAFGSSDFTPPTKLSKDAPPPSPRDYELGERQRQFAEQQFRGTITDLNTKVNNSLKSTIDAHIDINNSMSDYVKRNAVRDAIDTLETLISKDTRFRVLTDKLWRSAQENNFSKESVDRIKSAYLAKSKALLPSVIKKARNDALRSTSRKTSDETTESSGSKKGPVTPGKPSSNKNVGKITDAKEIPRGMSTLEFLDS